MIISKHVLMEGYELRWWEGIAWYNPKNGEVVTLPIPVNLIYRLWRRFTIWLKLPEAVLIDTAAYLIGKNEKLEARVAELEEENKKLRKGYE